MPNYISAIKLPSGDVYQIKDSGALRLTGGQVTGPVNFGDSVYISDLNAGTLIVTGNSAFTNNIQANTINGVEVGPNPKFTDTGTVTSVAATGANGITISGSPITSAGTITIGLNLNTAINGLGEGTSPANRNDYAVVQYAGGGTSTVSYHRRKLSNVFAALNSTDITNALGGNKSANVVFAGPSSGTAAAPNFRALVEADIPGLAWSKITSGNDDLKAIEALTGTSGLLKKTAANTWTLDTSTYLTGITSSQIINALGFTPYSNANPSGYTTNTGTVTSVQVKADSPLQSSTNTAQTSTLNTTISFTKQNVNTVLAGPSSGSSSATPSFRALVSADLPAGTNSEAGAVKLGASGGAATYDHAHGSLSSAGIISTSTAIANGDKLVIIDSSDSNKIKGSTLVFGTSESSFLTNKGTWATPANTTYAVFVKSGSTAAAGLVPKPPTTAGTAKFLRQDASWADLPSATANAAGIVKLGASGGAATYEHTHSASLASDNTSSGVVSLSHGGQYKLTAGGSSVIFKLPSDIDTDTKVANAVASTTKYYITGTTSASASTGTQVFDTGVYVTTVAGQLSALHYSVHDGAATPAEKVKLEWNSTDSSLDFIFI